MPKDTKSLDNNKAPACESRGFVHKKEGVHFDTPSFFIQQRCKTGHSLYIPSSLKCREKRMSKCSSSTST